MFPGRRYSQRISVPCHRHPKPFHPSTRSVRRLCTGHPLDSLAPAPFLVILPASPPSALPGSCTNFVASFFAAPPYWQRTRPLRCPHLLRSLRRSRIDIVSAYTHSLLRRPSGLENSRSSPTHRLSNHTHTVELRNRSSGAVDECDPEGNARVSAGSTALTHEQCTRAHGASQTRLWTDAP